MEIQFFLIFFIIFILSILQSVIGVGILLFGTPTFLILGYSYTDTLAMLLPASVGISLFQIFGKFDIVRTKSAILIYTLPMVIISLSVILYFEFSIDIKKVVGLMLILLGLLRVSSYLKHLLKNIFISNRYFYCVLMGFIHGISNMGGGLLVLFMDSMFKLKDEIRINVAFGYLLFGIVQIFVLVIFSIESFNVMSVVLPFVAIITYYFLGNRISSQINENSYQYVVTFFIFIYGILSFINL
jgi:uncharacterized protein